MSPSGGDQMPMIFWIRASGLTVSNWLTAADDGVQLPATDIGSAGLLAAPRDRIQFERGVVVVGPE
jgi:hypothetical protein